MEITKTVPVTIKVNSEDTTECEGSCDFMDQDCDWCYRYSVRLPLDSYARCPACLAEFGTGVENATASEN